MNIIALRTLVTRCTLMTLMSGGIAALLTTLSLLGTFGSGIGTAFYGPFLLVVWHLSGGDSFQGDHRWIYGLTAASAIIVNALLAASSAFLILRTRLWKPTRR